MNQKNIFQSLFEIIRFAIITLAIVIPIRAYVAQPFIVNGSSMLPTFHNGEYLIIDEFSYHFRPPQRGEVVVFKYPQDTKKYFIKRVIGLPGETVEIENGTITITKLNGEKEILSEPYMNESILFDQEKINKTIGENEYFVMGDNRDWSFDSRTWGTVPDRLIKGRAFVRLFPINNISYLPGSLEKY